MAIRALSVLTQRGAVREVLRALSNLAWVIGGPTPGGPTGPFRPGMGGGSQGGPPGPFLHRTGGGGSGDPAVGGAPLPAGVPRSGWRMSFPASVFDNSATPTPLSVSSQLPHRPDPSASEHSDRCLVTAVRGEWHGAGWLCCVTGGSALVSTSALSSVAISGPASDAKQARSAPVGGTTGTTAAAPDSFSAPLAVPASDVHVAAPSGRRPSVATRADATEAAGALSRGDPLIVAYVPAETKGAVGATHQRQQRSTSPSNASSEDFFHTTLQPPPASAASRVTEASFLAGDVSLLAGSSDMTTLAPRPWSCRRSPESCKSRGEGRGKVRSDL